MKTLREVADELCPYRLEDYDPAIDDMSDELIRMGWINGFITGAQWREDNPVAADSASDPESDSIACCGIRRIWPSVVTRRTAIITTYGMKRWRPRGPLGSACRPGRNGKHYAISVRLGTTSARAVGLGATTTRTTRARYSCLLRACAAAIAARAPTATIVPRRRTTEATATRATSTSTRATSTRWAATIAPTASACVACGINDSFILQLSNNN